MSKFVILLGFGVALATSAQAGELEVCRPDYLDKRLNQQALAAPAGIVFEDWGKEKDDTVKALKTRWELRLVTTVALKFKPGQRCTTVQASIARDSQRREVAPKDNRYFEPAGMRDGQGGDLDPYPPVWDRISQMSAKAVSQFR